MLNEHGQKKHRSKELHSSKTNKGLHAADIINMKSTKQTTCGWTF